MNGVLLLTSFGIWVDSRLIYLGLYDRLVGPLNQTFLESIKLVMRNRKQSVVIPLTVASLMTAGQAQELVPNDPAIVESLGAWFRDAATTFDPETGIWADSSGKDNHAIPVGEINVVAPVTYVGPTLGTISGGAFSTEDVSSVHFANDIDDLLVAADLNMDAGLTDVTIFVVYNVNFLAANPNLTRSVGIGSIAGVQANLGDNLNLAGDPSLRKDNGQLGSGTYSLPFPVETTFIRTARMSTTAVDEWFNTDGTLTNVLTLPGVSYTTSTDDFFLGDLRCGNTPVPGLGTATSRADFDIMQTLVYTAALSDEQVAGVNEWLVNNIGSGAPSNDLAITGIEVDSAAGSATIEWNSRAGGSYAVDVSEDLEVWEELDDGIESEGEVTTFTETELAGATPRFYRVREL